MIAGLGTTGARLAFALNDSEQPVVVVERDPANEHLAGCRERGVKVIAMVATVDDARAVAASGVDAVVAQGSEAGGHRSTWVKPASREAAQVGGMALIPQIVDAVDLPVIAAGGIASGQRSRQTTRRRRTRHRAPR